MNNQPIDKIRKLSEIQTQIFDIITELADFDVNTAQQNLRNAAADIATGMGKIAMEYETKTEHKPAS